MSHLTQGPGCPTQNSQQAGIADRILSFARHRPSPSDSADQAAPTGVPTVVQTPASPVPELDSPTEGGFLHTPNPFLLEEDHEFSTTIHQPIFQTPGPETLELPAESAGRSATESSVTDDYVRYQNQLTDTLRAMTDRLTALSIAPAPPAPTTKSRVATEPRPARRFGLSKLGHIPLPVYHTFHLRQDFLTKPTRRHLCCHT
jgi:hypothetical protein